MGSRASATSVSSCCISADNTPDCRRRLWRSLGWIVDAPHFLPGALFREQFHGGLKAVDGTVVAPGTPRPVADRPVPQPGESRAYDLAYNRPFFCSVSPLISFLIGATPCERHLFLLIIRHHFLIDELPAMIGIDAQDRERKERLCALEGCQRGLPTALQEREAFSPACRDVRQGQGIQVTSLRFSPTMGNQICWKSSPAAFHSSLGRCGSGSGVSRSVPAWVVEIPPGQGCRRERRSRSAEARAHREQLVPVLLRQVQMSMPQKPLQRGEAEKASAVWRRYSWRRSRPGTARVGRRVHTC